jgi:hypothetical protein
MSIWDDGIIHGIRDLIRKWRGLPRFGYGRCSSCRLAVDTADASAPADSLADCDC